MGKNLGQFYVDIHKKREVETFLFHSCVFCQIQFQQSLVFLFLVEIIDFSSPFFLRFLIREKLFNFSFSLVFLFTNILQKMKKDFRKFSLNEYCEKFVKFVSVVLGFEVPLKYLISLFGKKLI